MKTLMKIGVLLFVITLLMTSGLFAQSSSGTVSGTVRDQSGAVIPAVPVVLINTGTDVTSTTRTNDAGFFFFPGAVVGSYRLTVEVKGMEKYEGAFAVEVAQSLVVDPVLKPGQAMTTVEVKDVTPLVQTDNGTVASSMERARIEQLPINGHQINTFQTLLPGSEGTGGTNGFIFFGLTSEAEAWIIDGTDVTDRRWNMSLASQSPGTDSVQEFVIAADAVSAKYTRPVNAVVSTKSGTNKFHGSLYEMLRNNGIGLARARTDYYTRPPELIRNEFGGTAGGPVYIPKIYNGKNRTFWFVDYEALHLVQNTTANYEVPTAAMRNGDFSGLIDAQGNYYTMYDPASTGAAPNYLRTPFPNNQIPTNRESPLAQYLFSITPLPNYNANPLVASNWYGVSENFNHYSTFVSRVDHHISDKDQLFVRFTRAYAPNTQNTSLPTSNNESGWKSVLDHEFQESASWIHTFSPTFTNEFLPAGRYRVGGGYSGVGSAQGVDWFSKLGMPNPFGVQDWPMFTNTGLSTYTLIAPGTDRANETNVTLDDNAVKVFGKHELLFGVHLRDNLYNIHPNNAAQDSFTFNTDATALYSTSASTPTNPAAVPYTGSNIANMYLGAATYQASLFPKWFYFRQKEEALYFQDNYRVTSRLTVNLGLRWEYWGAYNEKNGVLAGFDPANHAIVLGTGLNTLYSLNASVPSIVQAYQNLGLKFETYQQAGLPQSMVHADDKNLGPRAGYALRLFNGRKTLVMRGGYSLSYFTPDVNSLVSNISNNTPFDGTFNYNPLDASQSPNGLPNYGLISNQAYVAGLNSTSAISLATPRGVTPGTASITYMDPNLATSRVHSWNTTIEKELTPNIIARARYIGYHSSHLTQYNTYNNAPSSYIWYETTHNPLPTGTYANVATRPYDQQVLGTVQEYTNTGWGNDQSIDLELERRFHDGIAFQFSYVMTNALTTGEFSSVPAINQYMPGLVPTDYHARDKFLDYKRDSSLPKNRVRWNWLVDLPFGKGKRVANNAGPLLNTLIGHWQLAGIGTLRSNWVALTTSYYNFTAPLQQNKYKYPIQNCTSGTCVPGYLWYNGYIPADLINSHAANGQPNGYEGVPASYQAAVKPLVPWGQTALPPNAPSNLNISGYYDTNDVWIPLNNGTTQLVSYSPGVNPWQNQYIPGVWQWDQDASLFKNFPFRERANLRFTADFFNVFNHPDNPNSVSAAGFLSTQASGQNPRVLQLSLRLTW